MSEFSYTYSFTLNKHYLSECYEQSAVFNRSWRVYARAFILIVVALLLLKFTELDTYISLLILTLGLIDAAGSYYHKAWWLARQALSSSYNSLVNLSIDTAGITTQSPQASNVILWADIKQIITTDKGLIIHHSKGQSYLSKSALNFMALEYIQSKQY